MLLLAMRAVQYVKDFLEEPLKSTFPQATFIEVRAHCIACRCIVSEVAKLTDRIDVWLTPR
jgi:hypothetical protein